MLGRGAQVGPGPQQATSSVDVGPPSFPSAVGRACRPVLHEAPACSGDTTAQYCQLKQEWDMARSYHCALLPCMEGPALSRPRKETEFPALMPTKKRKKKKEDSKGPNNILPQTGWRPVPICPCPSGSSSGVLWGRPCHTEQLHTVPDP